MSIQETYNELILEDIIKDILLEGEEPTLEEIIERFEDFLEENDTSKALFKSEDYSVSPNEHASATKYNNTNRAILQDLTILYKEMLSLSAKTVDNMDRWRTEIADIDARLGNLNNQLGDLLVLAQDIEGYDGFVGDSFQNLALVDLENTSAQIDLVQQTVSIPRSSEGATRINLNSILETDVTFSVITRNNLRASLVAPGGELINAFHDNRGFWQHRIYNTRPFDPISCELRIRLGTENVSLTRISIELHTANTNSGIQITPLLSEDGINFSQLSISDFTKNVVSAAEWVFPSTEARFVKFIMTKLGHDLEEDSAYIYEFGANYIRFYVDGYESSEVPVAQLITQPLAIEDVLTGVPREFNKIALEVCERIPEDTRLEYSVTVSNNSLVPIDADTNWISIYPQNRDNPLGPIVLDLGDLTAVTVEDISISYDPTVVLAQRNPADSFNLLAVIDEDPSSITLDDDHRYTFINSNERILDLQISQDIEFSADNARLWRNIGSAGSTTTVREISQGWGLADPYYFTTIRIDAAPGLQMNLGPRYMIIDGSARTGMVTLTKGIHTIKVHRDNWHHVSSGIASFSDLVAADPRFPYNHKLLVEGYSLNDERNPYKGADLFAQYLMERVPTLSFVNSVPVDDYSRYALDLDTGDSTNDPSRVFVVKVDEENSDFLNEEFRLEFNAINQLFQFLRLRVLFYTSDTSLTPSLDAWRLKVGN